MSRCKRTNGVLPTKDSMVGNLDGFRSGSVDTVCDMESVLNQSDKFDDTLAAIWTAKVIGDASAFSDRSILYSPKQA